MVSTYSAISFARRASVAGSELGDNTARPGGSTGGAELARGDMGCSGARFSEGILRGCRCVGSRYGYIELKLVMVVESTTARCGGQIYRYIFA